AEAGNAAIADAGIDRHEIQALYMGNYNGNGFNNQNTLAAMAASSLGIPEVPTQRFEAACASGGVAFRNAMIAVASGIYDTVMVMGVEKMNIPLDQADADSQMNWAKSGVDYQYESGVGMNGATMFAMFAHRHMHEYGTTREMLAISASKNKYHGSLNPYAYKQREVPVEKIMKSPLIATPFSAQEVSLVTDGSAAVILTTKDRAKSMGKKDAVKVMGSGHGGGSFSVAFRDSFTRMRATVEAANEAFKMANIDRKDISVVECHDCFSFTELMNIEDLGFVEKGKGGWFAADGNTRLGGKLPVNTSGGLCSKGHPIGATGVGQIVEMAWQLQDKSDKRQVENAKFALTHVLGGPGSVSTVHILGRGDI
ncbi:MAG: acetyl-CoA acetyltransferase, partial [Leptospiraceae bacterium]|nr:acetyl-CoA acetyltransferase [Leptospiraceae bacterium]